MQTKDEEGTKAGSQIRRHLPGDGALLDGSADPARLEACLALPGALFFVALDDGRDVAQAAGMIHPHLDRPAVFSSTMSANDCLVAPRHCQHANGRTLRQAHGASDAAGGVCRLCLCSSTSRSILSLCPGGSAGHYICVASGNRRLRSRGRGAAVFMHTRQARKKDAAKA